MVQSGRRGGVRTAIEFFSGLVKLQKDAGRHVIIEGKAADVPVRDEVFTAPNRLGDILGKPKVVHWCALGITGHNADRRILCGEHLVMSSIPWEEKPCVCGRQSSHYAATADVGYEQFCSQILKRYDLIKEV